MQLVQILLAAASLTAAGGGAGSLERMIERHARSPAMTVDAIAAALRAADEEEAEDA